MNNNVICFVEKELLEKIPNEVIVERFDAVKDHHGIKRKVMCQSSSFDNDFFPFQVVG